jgi:hypothetical protein
VNFVSKSLGVKVFLFPARSRFSRRQGFVASYFVCGFHYCSQTFGYSRVSWASVRFVLPRCLLVLDFPPPRLARLTRSFCRPHLNLCRACGSVPGVGLHSSVRTSFPWPPRTPSQDFFSSVSPACFCAESRAVDLALCLLLVSSLRTHLSCFGCCW